MTKLIENYSINMVTPPGAPGAPIWEARVTFQADASEVMPYLNAELPRAQYDPTHPVIIWRRERFSFALRPTELWAHFFKERSQAEEAIAREIDFINHTWGNKDRITPNHNPKTPPAAGLVYPHLPLTNCKQCGEETCLGFAWKLARGEAELDKCPPMNTPEYTEKRRCLLELLEEEKTPAD